MERVALSPELELSRIVYGMWRIADDADTSPAHVERKIELCLDQGITSFDQAAVYGGYTAEAVLGDALRANPGLRDKMEIVTKCGIVAPVGRFAAHEKPFYDTSAQHIRDSLDLSLKAMGTDHVDLLLIHRPDPFMDHEETGRALDDLVTQGKTRSVGVSNFRPYDWDLLQSAMTTPLVTNQIELSLGHLSPFTNGDVAFHQKNAQRLMAWSPLGGGSLMTQDSELGQLMDAIASDQGVDRSAVAVAFLLAHPAGILPVMGTNNLDRIARLATAETVKIDRETWFQLYQAGLGHAIP